MLKKDPKTELRIKVNLKTIIEMIKKKGIEMTAEAKTEVKTKAKIEMKTEAKTEAKVKVDLKIETINFKAKGNLTKTRKGSQVLTEIIHKINSREIKTNHSTDHSKKALTKTLTRRETDCIISQS